VAKTLPASTAASAKADAPSFQFSAVALDRTGQRGGRVEVRYFLKRGGNFLEIWEIEPSSRKVRVFLWRDATGVGIGARGCGAWGTRG
jgi:hypothetical protein